MDGPLPARSHDALVFSVLDSEIRLAILDALYDRTVEPGPFSGETSYSSIKEAVGIDDSGQFNYHLDRLTDEFVIKFGDAYRLTERGREIVRLRRTGTLTENPRVAPEPVDSSCYLCGAPIEVFYANGFMVTRCPSCAGAVDTEIFPTGTISALPYPPSGVDGVDIETAFERVHRRFMCVYRAMARGFCPTCGHDVRVIFPRHEGVSDDEVDLLQHVTHDGLVMFSCTYCGQHRVTHPLSATDDRDPMAHYFIDRTVDPGWDRLATALSWDVDRREDAMVFETDDAARFVVDEQLDVSREA